MTSNKILFVVSSVTETEIEKIIGNLKESSSGWDKLKPRMMTFIKQSIKIPLMHISKLSFQKGVFPTELRIANVVPIFKSGDETIFTNYRPLSVLPVFLILKRLKYNRLIEFINENGLLCEYQFGFQKGKSTSMALVTLIDKVTEALDTGECIIGVFLDFSKAFDTVDHDISLQKLTLYGIQDIMLKWFKDYLSNRVQYVTYNGMKSMRENQMWSSTRIDTWASLIFLIYINDLCQVSEFSLPLLFADDTNLFITGNHTEEMCAKLNGDLKYLRMAML